MENNKKLFTAKDLEELKNALPGHYKRAFDKIWESTQPETELPKRQNVYAVLNGVCENDKILTVLVAVVENRNELRAKLQIATSDARKLQDPTTSERE
jgi:hypothetical protein